MKNPIDIVTITIKAKSTKGGHLLGWRGRQLCRDSTPGTTTRRQFKKWFVMFVFFAAHVNVWQSDHGRQPCLLQPSAGNSLKTMPMRDVKKKLNQSTSSFYRKQRLFLPWTWQSSLRNSPSLVSMFTGQIKSFQDERDCPRWYISLILKEL